MSYSIISHWTHLKCIMIALSCIMSFVSSKPEDVDQWDHLVFSQIWPGTECVQREYCQVPKEVSYWTVHGLWPTQQDSEGPNFCNSSWHFNISTIQPIMTDLKIKWPNYDTNEKYYSLWKHEWIKHGTCAATLPALQGEMNFFSKSLQLRNSSDLLAVLQNSQIVPNDQVKYDVKTVLKNLYQHFGHTVALQCIFLKHNISMLSQIEICFNKQLEYIDCGHSGNCIGDIFYPTIKRTVRKPDDDISLWGKIWNYVVAFTKIMFYIWSI